ncbi:MAG: hypothetical protein WBF90_27380 [Rivularia sp. (in: cyanobacteria)]
MLNRVASIFCLTIGFTALCSNQITLAQSVNVYFSGTIEPHASFEISTPSKIESIVSGKSGKITNGFTDITPARINVQTSTPTIISVSSPQSNFNSDTANTEHTATLRVDSSRVSGKNITLPAGKNTVEIDMSLKQNPVLAPGIYNYDVTLTMVNP